MADQAIQTKPLTASELFLGHARFVCVCHGVESLPLFSHRLWQDFAELTYIELKPKYEGHFELEFEGYYNEASGEWEVRPKRFMNMVHRFTLAAKIDYDRERMMFDPRCDLGFELGRDHSDLAEEMFIVGCRLNGFHGFLS